MLDKMRRRRMEEMKMVAATMKNVRVSGP